MLGNPLRSTEGVVALFAYACDTLSRPAADDRRNRVRHGLVGEFCDARQLTSFCRSAARQWGAAADSEGSRPRAGSFRRFGCGDFWADSSAFLTCSRSRSNSRN